MPPVLPPVNEAIFAQIGQMRSDIRAMQSQQQMTLSNVQGQSVLNFGLSPGSNPAQYGLQAVNPSTGTEIGFWGEDSGGHAALKFRNGSGVVQAQFDVNGLHIYDTSGNEVVRLDSTGLHVYNSSGTEEVAAGLLNASPVIYGMATLGPAGVLQLVSGVETSAPGHLSNTTVTSWTVPTGTSSVTAEIGPSGQAEVTVSGQCSTGTGGQEAFIGCQIDGTTVPVSALVSSGTGGVSVSTSAGPIVISGLTTGSHTFEPVVQTAANGTSTVSFTNVTVTVTPL